MRPPGGGAARGSAAWLAAGALALAPCAPNAAAAQGDSTRHAGNTWLVYNGTHDLSARLGLHLEAQLRRTDGIAAPKQLLLRPGVRVAFGDKVAATVGYAFQRTSPQGLLADPVATREHRGWQQVEIEAAAGRLTLQHRARLEQRWQEEVASDGPGAPRVTGWAYENRARYQLRLTRPLRSDASPGGDAEAPGWYLTATEEPFVRFGRDVGRAFDQNRAFLGVGRRWGEALRAEAGYLNQYARAARGRALEVSHVLQAAVYADAPFRRAGR